MADAAKISANDLFSGDPNEIFVDPVHVPVNYDYVFSNDVQ